MLRFIVSQLLGLENAVANDLPYLSSYKNVSKLFDQIQSAQRPEVFSKEFLSKIIGLQSSTDRPLISFLRSLGFLDTSNRPSAEYSKLKDKATRGLAIASAVKRAYAPLFTADEQAHKRDGEQLKGIVARVAGTDESMTSKIVGTFNAIAKLADFSVDQTEAHLPDLEDEAPNPAASNLPTFRPEFHYNIQIHLPGGASEETYRNIFNALRETFKKP
jgi:Family of unknown function (DUF5343)